jgi:alkylation response protein AidB-like acyl-CoA dehydrogenase
VTESAPSLDVEEITAACERFLRAELPADWVAAVDAGDADALRSARDLLDVDDWFVRLADAGYVTPTWPVEYGGLGVAHGTATAINRVLTKYRVPRFTNPVGVDLAGPALLRWGSEEHKQRYLRPIARHQEIWCQLFSEPGSGSDLAGLSTRAVRDGDVWKVNGQKVWTSLGHLASFGMLLARTDPDVPKHQGITAFIMPMRQPGVTVRPLRHMAGDVEFTEVFFDDAMVEDSMRLGNVGDGWKFAQSVLGNERQAVSGPSALPGTTTGRSVEGLIKRHAPLADPVLRQRLVQLWIEDKVITYTGRQAAARRKAGQPPGPGGSILKLLYSEHTQRLQNLACDLEGPGAQAWTDDDRYRKNTAWSLMRIPSKTIAGGTSEVQRNILGERILGLPREPQVDRDVPWSQVRHS